MRWMGYLVALLLFSCDQHAYQSIDEVYIIIPETVLKTSTNQFQSQNLRDLWVYSDDVLLGAFPIPARIPIVRKDSFRLRFFPGIREFGILARPEIYTLMDPYSIVQKDLGQDTLVLKPIFSYKNNMITLLQEGFESGSVFTFDLDTIAGHSLMRSNQSVKEGNSAGLGMMDLQRPVIEVASIGFTIKPSSRMSAFVELDFKSDSEVKIGLNSFAGSIGEKNYFFTLRPNSEWKKVYIPLSEFLNVERFNSFQLLIKSDLAKSSTSSFFTLDNIRIICLP